MNKPVSISVLMTAYNAEQYIAEAIQSVLEQEFTDFEFIIINDGSTDDTRKIIRSFTDARIRCIDQENKGIAIALNNGLQEAKGKYIARFDADDICYPQRLKKQYAFMQENPDHIIIGSAVDYIDQYGEFIFTYSPPAFTNEEIQAVKQEICPFIHSGVLYQRDIVLKKGGYDPHAHSFEDHLLWLKIIEEGRAFNFHEPLIKVRLNPGSVTIDEKWRPKEFHRIKTKVIRQKAISAEEGQQLLQIIETQNIKKIKEGAYYSLLAKKYLWNNYHPAKARENLKKVIAGNWLHWKSYIFFLLSFLPENVLRKSYELFKFSPAYISRRSKGEQISGKRTRLLVDAHCFDREYQGSRSFLKGIYTELVKKTDIHFFIAANDTTHLREHFPEAANISFLKFKSRAAYFRLTVNIPLLIRKHRIDYAHFQYFTPLVKNCKQIVTIHDVIFKEDPRSFSRGYRFIKTFLYKRSAGSADLVTTVSAYSRNSIVQHLQADARKIAVVANAVAPHYFEPYDKDAARAFIKTNYGFDRFLLCVSRFEPRKNQLLLLEEFLSLSLYTRGYHLVLLGHETMKTKGLHDLLNELPSVIRQFIFISNSVNEEDLLQFYRAADLFIYPSQSEGFGIPPLEAGAARVPVICSNRSAMRDFLFFGKGHIDPAIPGLLKKTIATVLNSAADPEILQFISNEIKKTYSWKKSSEDLYQLIVNHSNTIHDQFSTIGNKEGRVETAVSPGKTLSLSRD